MEHVFTAREELLRVFQCPVRSCAPKTTESLGWQILCLTPSLHFTSSSWAPKEANLASDICPRAYSALERPGPIPRCPTSCDRKPSECLPPTGSRQFELSQINEMLLDQLNTASNPRSLSPKSLTSP